MLGYNITHRPMKKNEKPVVILIRNASPFDFGGGERFPVFISQVIRDRYIPIILSRSPKLLQNATNFGIKTIRGLWWSNQRWSGLRLVFFPLYILWQLFLTLWYFVVFLRLRPRVVHIQSKDDFIAATFAARFLGQTVIWTDHADLKHIWRNLRVWYKNPIGKWVYLAAHFVHAITVISKSEQREVTIHLPERSAVRSRIHLINNGTPDVYDNYPKALSDIFTFCSTNRLVTDKGIGEMITAFKQFHSLYPASRLVLVGSGPEESLFRKLASDTQAIVFAGYQADPLSYVASSHVLLQPTYHEGFSISILEAFMMQKPVIATSIGGNLEMIINKETGLLVPARDTNALCSAMVRLYESPKLRKKLALKARRVYADNYIFEEIVSNCYIPLYERRMR